MNDFYYEIPSIKRKDDALDYIQEHYDYNSKINGVGGLHRYLDDYEGWLKKLDEDYNRTPSEDLVPARTYFLIRKSDDKIIGMTNIRLTLNKRLKETSGHIGYGIRPTERGNGYNKINLYLALKECENYNIDEALLSADIKNEASWRTMEALGGVKREEYYDEEEQATMVHYTINVKEALDKYHDTYEPYILSNKTKQL